MINQTALWLAIVLLYYCYVECVKDTYSFEFGEKLDPSWVVSECEQEICNSRIKCAALCYQQHPSCYYWGYNGTCYILKDSLDQETCSEENCTSPGMRIYKVTFELGYYVL